MVLTGSQRREKAGAQILTSPRVLGMYFCPHSSWVCLLWLLSIRGTNRIHLMYRFVEIMAPVFSKDAWRCVWHMIQVHLSYFHFWILQRPSFLRNCSMLILDAEWLGSRLGPGFCSQEMCGGMLCLWQSSTFQQPAILNAVTEWGHLLQPAHEKIGVVDSQWIVHQVVPSLGNQVRRDTLCF